MKKERRSHFSLLVLLFATATATAEVHYSSITRWMARWGYNCDRLPACTACLCLQWCCTQAKAGGGGGVGGGREVLEIDNVSQPKRFIKLELLHLPFMFLFGSNQRSSQISVFNHGVLASSTAAALQPSQLASYCTSSSAHDLIQCYYIQSVDHSVLNRLTINLLMTTIPASKQQLGDEIVISCAGKSLHSFGISEIPVVGVQIVISTASQLQLELNPLIWEFLIFSSSFKAMVI